MLLEIKKISIPYVYKGTCTHLVIFEDDGTKCGLKAPKLYSSALFSGVTCRNCKKSKTYKKWSANRIAERLLKS